MSKTDSNAGAQPLSKGRLSRLREFMPLLLIVVVVMGVSQMARQWQSAGQAEQLRAAVRPGDIVMLSSTHCVYCRRARSWMEAEKIAFRECFIETDEACAALYRAQMAPGTPTFLVKGQRVVGFDKQRLLELTRAGQQ